MVLLKLNSIITCGKSEYKVEKIQKRGIILQDLKSNIKTEFQLEDIETNLNNKIMQVKNV